MEENNKKTVLGMFTGKNAKIEAKEKAAKAEIEAKEKAAKAVLDEETKKKNEVKSKKFQEIMEKGFYSKIIDNFNYIIDYNKKFVDDVDKAFAERFYKPYLTFLRNYYIFNYFEIKKNNNNEMFYFNKNIKDLNQYDHNIIKPEDKNIKIIIKELILHINSCYDLKVHKKNEKDIDFFSNIDDRGMMIFESFYKCMRYYYINNYEKYIEFEVIEKEIVENEECFQNIINHCIELFDDNDNDFADKVELKSLLVDDIIGFIETFYICNTTFYTYNSAKVDDAFIPEKKKIIIGSIKKKSKYFINNPKTLDILMKAQSSETNNLIDREEIISAFAFFVIIKTIYLYKSGKVDENDIFYKNASIIPRYNDNFERGIYGGVGLPGKYVGKKTNRIKYSKKNKKSRKSRKSIKNL